MPTPRRIALPGISSVAPGSTATLDLSNTKVRYHRINLYHTRAGVAATQAQMEAEITEIRINIDGTTQRRIKPAQLFKSNSFKGYPFSAGNIPIFFSEPFEKELPFQYATALGTKGIRSLQIEIDFAAGATTPALRAWALVDDVQEPPLGIVKWKIETVPVTATGERTIKLDNKSDSLRFIHLFETTPGDITKASLKWNGVEMLNSFAQDNYMDCYYAGFAPQSGMFSIPFDFSDLNNVLPMVMTDGSRVPDVELVLTMGAAANVTVLREVLGIPD